MACEILLASCEIPGSLNLMTKTVAMSERQKATRDEDGYRVVTTEFLSDWPEEEKTVQVAKPKCLCVICKGFPE
jgi:hypothetical protein